MTTPLCKQTLIGATLIALLALIALPLYPVAVLSFEIGLVVGVLLHSSHTKAGHEQGFLQYGDRKA